MGSSQVESCAQFSPARRTRNGDCAQIITTCRSRATRAGQGTSITCARRKNHPSGFRSSIGCPQVRGRYLCTDLCTRPAGTRRDRGDALGRRRPAAAHRPRSAPLPKTSRDAGDARRTAHNLATTGRSRARRTACPLRADRTANHGDSRSLTDSDAHHLTCVYAVRRACTRSLPSWSCGFDSRHPLSQVRATFSAL